MMEKITEYLRTHPLAVEILTLIVDDGKASPSELAQSLGLTTQTIYAALIDMRSKGIVESTKKGRKTEYIVLDNDAVKSVLKNRELLQSILKSSTKLRRPSLLIMRLIRNFLIEVLNGMGIPCEKDMEIDIPTGKAILGIVAKAVQEKKVYVDIRRIPSVYKVTSYLHHQLGRDLSITRGTHQISGIIVALLMPENVPTLKRWEVINLFRSLSTKNIRVDVVIIYVNDEELLSEAFIKELARQINDRLRLLV